MEMPYVGMCDVTDCAYNTDKKCHALAITVGDAQDAKCDTYWKRGQGGASEGGDPNNMAGVGACHMSGCEYNERLECAADEIEVSHSGGKVICATYSPR